MTTTPTTTRKGICNICTTRRIGPDRDARGCELCNRCFFEAGLENEHSDYGHPEPVKGCPTCGLGSDLTAVRTQSASTIDKTGTCKCDTCHHVLPVTKFPTVTAKGIRLTVCRACRDYAAAGKRIGRPAHVPRPMSVRESRRFADAVRRAAADARKAGVAA